jgi:hypothetical protein
MPPISKVESQSKEKVQVTREGLLSLEPEKQNQTNSLQILNRCNSK